MGKEKEEKKGERERETTAIKKKETNQRGGRRWR